MAALIYTLCALTCAVTAWLLLRGHHRTRFRLLFWAGLCFAMLTVSNALVVADRIFLPDVSLGTWRLATTLAALGLLLYGLIWQGE
jgi:hypothetical protein